MVAVARGAGATGVGTSFGEPLRLCQTAWSQGMGEAQAASADGVSAMGLNPAGVFGTGFTTFHLTHTLNVTGITEDYFGYVQRLPLDTAMGLSFYLLRAPGGKRELEDEDGNWAGEAGTYPLMFMSGGAAWAMDLRWLLPGLDTLRPSGGVGLRVVNQQVDRASWLGVSGDVGVRLNPGAGFGGGLVLQNVGTAQSGYSLPRQFVGAVSWRGDRLFGSTDGLLVEVDAPIRREQGLDLRGGGEYRVVVGSVAIALRGGWRQDLSDTGASGISAGLGFRWLSKLVPWGLDYAYVPMGAFGTRHAVSLTVGLVSTTRKVEELAVIVEQEGQPPLRVFYPTKGERVYLPIRLREATMVLARLLDENGLLVTTLEEAHMVKPGKYEIGWDGQIAPGVWAQFDKTYHIFVQAGHQSFYLDCVPKTE
jgi:hypothetical protein